MTREEYNQKLTKVHIDEQGCEEAFYQYEIATIEYINSLEQRIVDLESPNYFPEPRTCEGCKWEYVDKFGVFACKSFQNYNCKRDIRVIDRYEPKKETE